MKLRRQHILYLVLLPIAYFLFKVQEGYSGKSPFFYGFAENKETDLSREHDVYVKDILVTQGQMVEEGQLLMIVERSDLQSKETELAYDVREKESELKAELASLKLKLSSIDQELQEYSTEYNTSVEQLKHKQKLLQDELAVLKTVPASTTTANAKTELTIRELAEKKQHFQQARALEREAVQQKIATLTAEYNLVQQRIASQQSSLQKQKTDLQILAPANGVIGNISTKKDELAKAFSNLMSFYQEKPTQVKGYVHESLILHVNLGDSLQVSSTLKPDKVVTGTVVGLGSRIVEIPERLRKMPSVKTYGREIIVDIPSHNNFLQKEKVSLNTDIDLHLVKPVNMVTDRVEKDIKKTLTDQ